MVSAVNDTIKKCNANKKLSPEKAKMEKLQLEETLLCYLNQSISDKEKESGLYRLEDAQAYMQGI